MGDGSDSKEVPPVNLKSARRETPTPPEKLAAGMDQDVRYQQIYQGLKQKAPKFYKDVEQTERGVITLQMDTERDFRTKYPADAKVYDQREIARLYDDYTKDPAVVKWALSERDWKEFVEKYPEKAKAYAAAGHAQIKMELDVQEELDKATAGLSPAEPPEAS